MANSTRGAGNPLVPIAIIAVVVAAIMVGVFAVRDDAPPDEPTIIGEDDINAEPAGAGTNPEGEVDPAEDGVTDQLDEVEPAAGGEIPAQENIDAGSSEETGSDEGEGSDARVQEVGQTTVEASEAGGADGEQPVDAQAGDADAPEDDPSTIVDESDGNADPEVGAEGTQSSTDAPTELPEGRDAQTELTPEPGQDVVGDTDEGGAAFVPTPSGPTGRDGTTIAD